ncbi:hypothetical protein BDZ89DRAFT_140718 [Hymenopellis radicata]|nr:hypothetical protein BDZ89DRAFT_140718 [Hymenopellis radicata]
MPVTTDPQRSLFVTLFAATISFIGLGVSILAVWILWLVPRARPAMPEVQLKKPKPDKARRRSAPPVLFPSTASSSLSPPSPLIPIITVASKGADSSGRHVSFLDSQIRTRRNTRRYSAPPEPVHPDYEEFSDSSPLSSSSTLVATPSSKHVNVLTPIISEAGESSATDSDSSRRSSRSSPLLSYRMSKMKNPLERRRESRPSTRLIS